jgi:hypothetical protein
MPTSKRFMEEGMNICCMYVSNEQTVKNSIHVPVRNVTEVLE